MDLKNVVGVLSPYFTGTIDACGALWLHRARKAEREGKELVVLEVLKNELIEPLKLDFELDIELYIKLDVG
jgi:hypothetical protein